MFSDGADKTYWRDQANREYARAHLDFPDPDAFSQNLMNVQAKPERIRNRKGKRKKSRASIDNYRGRARERSI